MADKKISALTGATTPLAGTEVLPIVQGGSTVKVSVANLTVGRDTTVANLLTNGDITVRNAGSVIVGYAQNSAGWFDFAGSANVNGTQISSAASTPIRVLPAGAESVRFQTNGNVTLQTGNVVMAWPGKGIDFSANSNAPGMTSELLNWYEEGTFTATLTGFSSAPNTPITSTSRYTRIGRVVTVQIAFKDVNTTGASGAILVQGLPYAAGADAIGTIAQSGMASTNVAAGLLASGGTTVELIGAVSYVNLSFTAGAGQYLFVNITYTV